MSETIPEEVRKIAAEMVCAIPDGTLVANVRFLTKFAARAYMAGQEAADERAAKIAETVNDAPFSKHGKWAGDLRHTIASAIRDRSKS